jgi:hypothetical protein
MEAADLGIGDFALIVERDWSRQNIKSKTTTYSTLLAANIKEDNQMRLKKPKVRVQQP